MVHLKGQPGVCLDRRRGRRTRSVHSYQSRTLRWAAIYVKAANKPLKKGEGLVFHAGLLPWRQNSLSSWRDVVVKITLKPPLLWLPLEKKIEKSLL